MGSTKLTAIATSPRSAGLPSRWRWAARTARSASSTLLRIVLTAVLAATLGLMAWAVLPLAAGWHGRVVLSGSMQPAISPGDVVLAVPVDPSRLRPGQTIAFRDPARPDRVDVHRIVRRNSDGTFTTRGDANSGADSTPVPASSVVGLPRLRVPWIGLPQYWWRHHDYAAIGLAVGVLTAAMWTVVSAPRAAAVPSGRHRRM